MTRPEPVALTDRAPVHPVLPVVELNFSFDGVGTPIGQVHGRDYGRCSKTAAKMHLAESATHGLIAATVFPECIGGQNSGPRRHTLPI